MESILVLTNFSPGARSAAEAAVDLASQLRNDVILLNTFISSPISSMSQLTEWPLGDMPLNEAESRQYLEEELAHLETKLPNEGGKFRPTITYVQKPGSLSNNVKKLLKERAVRLVFMGGGQHDYLFGNHVRSLVEEVSCALMVVPSGVNRLRFHHITFGTDLDKNDCKRIKWVAQVFRALSFQLYVGHVDIANLIPDFMEEDLAPAFEAELRRINEPDIHFKKLKGGSAVDALEKFNQEVESDLLVLTHKGRGIVWRMFNQDLSDMLLREQKTPLLILPEQPPIRRE